MLRQNTMLAILVEAAKHNSAFTISYGIPGSTTIVTDTPETLIGIMPWKLFECTITPIPIDTTIKASIIEHMDAYNAGNFDTLAHPSNEIPIEYPDQDICITKKFILELSKQDAKK